MFTLYDSHSHKLEKVTNLEFKLDPYIQALEEVIESLYNGKLHKINRKITLETAKRLLKAVEEGYGKTFGTVDYNTPDGKMLQNLKENIYVFSGFKTYQQLKEITDFVIDPKTGKKRLFSEFKELVLQKNKTYNQHWLNAEYNHAVGGSRMASKWTEFTQFGDDPVLEYDAVADRRSRPQHVAWDNIRRKSSDSFWDTYFPPNGWNCRCSVRVAVNQQEHPLPKQLPPVDSKMFEVNLGKQNTVFPKNHPYYEASKRDQKQIKKSADDLREEQDGKNRQKGLFEEYSPSGKSVSSSLQLTTKRGEANDLHKEAFEVLDKIHGDGELKEIPLKMNSSKTAWGQYVHYVNSGEAAHIAIKRKGTHKHLTLWHEIGHWLDHQVLGEKGRFASKSNDPLMIEYKKAIENSKSIKDLRGAIKAGELNGKKVTYLNYDTIRYYCQDHEIWARAYSQYIAEKSGIEEYKEQYRKQAEHWTGHQWKDDDFKEISKAIDNILIQKQWRKRN